jgi:hypothetical protein
MNVCKGLLMGFLAVLSGTPLATAGIIIPSSVSETIVESRTGGLNFTAYSEGQPPAGTNNWQNSTAKSTAVGVTAGIGSRFNTSTNIGGATAWFQVAPTLPTAGGTYEIYVTATGSSQGNVTSTITQTGGTGLPATTTSFSPPPNAWNLVGTLVLNSGVNNPTIRFDETANSNRMYADAVLFAEVLTIPEPGMISLVSVGLLGVFSIRRRRFEF